MFQQMESGSITARWTRRAANCTSLKTFPEDSAASDFYQYGSIAAERIANCESCQFRDVGSRPYHLSVCAKRINYHVEIAPLRNCTQLQQLPNCFVPERRNSGKSPADERVFWCTTRRTNSFGIE